MRNYYEDSLLIRQTKLRAAGRGFEKVFPTICQTDKKSGKKAAVIGGGPAGLAAAAFLSRAGVPVAVFERRDTPGGVVAHVIPDFRITAAEIEKDIAICTASGAEIVCGREITSIDALKAEGYTDVIIAVGAWKHGGNPLESGECLDALEFLEKFKNDPAAAGAGKDIVVLGGGNTAMDVARAARRLPGSPNVRLVYRRTRRYMPADEEELQTALEDGVEFMELLAPARLEDGQLIRVGQLSNSGSGKYLSYTNTLRYAAPRAEPDQGIPGTPGGVQASNPNGPAAIAAPEDPAAEAQ